MKQAQQACVRSRARWWCIRTSSCQAPLPSAGCKLCTWSPSVRQAQLEGIFALLCWQAHRPWQQRNTVFTLPAVSTCKPRLGAAEEGPGGGLGQQGIQDCRAPFRALLAVPEGADSASCTASWLLMAASCGLH